MGVNRMLLTQQADGLEVLRGLLTANPKDIIASHEEARKQLALTEAEQVKYQEAQAFIAKYSELAASLKKDQDALELAKQEHAAQVADSSSQIKDEWEHLANMTAAANAKASAQTETDKRHADERKNLDVAAKELTARINAHDQKVSADMQVVANAKSANTNEAARLAALAESLRIKAQKIREQVSDF